MPNTELIVLWGEATHTLTVGQTRKFGGWDSIAVASPDTLLIRPDCPDGWARNAVDAFFALRDDPKTDLSHMATHELFPPRYQTIRPIKSDEDLAVAALLTGTDGESSC